MRPAFTDESRELAMEWRQLGRVATLVAVLTSPETLFYLVLQHDVAHRLIPRASLYGAEKPLLDEDVVARRRLWFWRTKWRRWTWILGSLFALLLIVNSSTARRRGGVAGRHAVARPDRARRPNLFKFSLTESNQDTNVFLVLDPLPTES